MPIFAAPALTIPQAIGIAMVVGFLTRASHDYSTYGGDAKETFLKAFASSFLYPIFALALGWIVHFFV